MLKTFALGTLALCALGLSISQAPAAPRAHEDAPKPAKNPISFFDIGVSDLARAEKFYAAVLGWEFKADPGMPDIFHHILNAGIEGGLVRHETLEPVAIPRTTLYFAVHCRADLDAKARLAERNGGKLAVPPIVVEPGVTIQVVHDPDGNPVGLSHDQAFDKACEH